MESFSIFTQLPYTLLIIYKTFNHYSSFFFKYRLLYSSLIITLFTFQKFILHSANFFSFSQKLQQKYKVIDRRTKIRKIPILQNIKLQKIKRNSEHFTHKTTKYLKLFIIVYFYLQI